MKKTFLRIRQKQSGTCESHTHKELSIHQFRMTEMRKITVLGKWGVKSHKNNEEINRFSVRIIFIFNLE